MKSQQPVLSMVLIPNGDNPLEVEKIDFSGLHTGTPLLISWVLFFILTKGAVFIGKRTFTSTSTIEI